MISSVSIAGMIFSGAIALLLPIILGFVLYRHKRYRLSFLFAGAAAFFFSQFIVRSMLLSALIKTPFHEEMANNFMYLFIIGALSAGIFEEGARYIGFSALKKKAPAWQDAVAFGIGHGGIEAIGGVGLSQINNIITSVMINTGMYESIMAPTLGDKAESIKAVYLETDPVLFFVSGLERMFIMPVHIFLSVLVCLAVIKKKPLLVLLSVLLHTAVNTPAIFSQLYDVPIWLIQAFIFLIGAGMMYGVIRLKGSFPSPASLKDNPEGDTVHKN